MEKIHISAVVSGRVRRLATMITLGLLSVTGCAAETDTSDEQADSAATEKQGTC